MTDTVHLKENDVTEGAILLVRIDVQEYVCLVASQL